MRFFLIHGEDSQKSYQRLLKFINEAKKRNWEIVFIDESTNSVPENLSSATLFTSTRFFVHRNAKKISQQDMNWIIEKSHNYEGNLVLYDDSELPKTFVANLPRETRVEDFKLSKLIWKLLDSFYPGNSHNFVKLLHDTAKNEPVELIFELLSRLLRDIYQIKVEPNSVKYPSWKLASLKKQSGKFSEQSVKQIISDFAEADVQSKTSSVSLIDSLDLISVQRLI